VKRFKNILLHTHGETQEKGTLQRALALAKMNEAQLTVVSVVEELPRDFQVFVKSMPPSDLKAFMIEEHKTRLEKFIGKAPTEGVQVDTQVLFGVPFIEIIKDVLRNKRDLVMKTASGKGTLKEQLLGSTEMHLMRQCPCPVWITKPTRRKQYDRILAAVDPELADTKRNSLNYKILELACSLAKYEDSELHIVHAWSLCSETYLKGATVRLPAKEVENLVKECEEIEQKAVDGLLAEFDLSNLRHQLHMIKGRPDEVISGIERELRPELIVMGTVSRTGLTGFLIGNTAEKVLGQVTCSVLTVKPDGFVTPVNVD